MTDDIRELARTEAVLLDIDGTLLDSNDAHVRSWLDAFGAHGRAFAYEQVRPLIGKGSDKLLQELLGLGDAERSKPGPDIVLAALRRAGMQPVQAMLIGDTPHDIQRRRIPGG